MKAPTTRQPQRLGYDLDLPDHMQAALAKCAWLGTQEGFASIPQHATGAQLVAWLGCKNWRMGHKRFLRSAYEAGRFCTEVIGC
jgi:hypothetical protein